MMDKTFAAFLVVAASIIGGFVAGIIEALVTYAVSGSIPSPGDTAGVLYIALPAFGLLLIALPVALLVMAYRIWKDGDQ